MNCENCSVDLDQAPDRLYDGIYKYLQETVTNNELVLMQCMVELKHAICRGCDRLPGS